ncbi:MAG TPA: permease [Arenicellales bacterium]|nr:permease [Arenicellales bacterium]
MSPTENTPRERRLDRMTLFFIALAAASAAGLGLRDGAGEVLDALGRSGMLLLGIGPVIVVALFLGGYVQALLPRDMVARWLGGDGGTLKYLLAIAAGVVTPAGPFGAFPLVVALRRAGAPFDVCVVYLSAWATLGLHRILIWELPFLGQDFVLLRVLASVPVPFAAGVLARMWLARRP